jgi:hypothetical protein
LNNSPNRIPDFSFQRFLAVVCRRYGGTTHKELLQELEAGRAEIIDKSIHYKTEGEEI